MTVGRQLLTIAGRPSRKVRGIAGETACSEPMTHTTLSINAPAQQAGPTEYLTFRLVGEEYAIDILKVREIRGYQPPTRIAQAPAHLKGVINLRGAIVPIVDLRVKFCGEAIYDEFTVVIILGTGAGLIGIVVDAVSDVTALSPEQLRPAPEFGAGVVAPFVTGLGTVGRRMLIVTDIERLLGAEGFAATPLQ